MLFRSGLGARLSLGATPPPTPAPSFSLAPPPATSMGPDPEDVRAAQLLGRQLAPNPFAGYTLTPEGVSVRRGGTVPPVRFNGMDFSGVLAARPDLTPPPSGPALAALPGPAPLTPPPSDAYLLTSPGERQRLALEAQLRAQHAVRQAEMQDKVDELVRAGMPLDQARSVAAGVPLPSWSKIGRAHV